MSILMQWPAQPQQVKGLYAEGSRPCLGTGLPGSSENIRRTAAIGGALAMLDRIRCHGRFAVHGYFFS